MTYLEILSQYYSLFSPWRAGNQLPEQKVSRLHIYQLTHCYLKGTNICNKRKNIQILFFSHDFFSTLNESQGCWRLKLTLYTKKQQNKVIIDIHFTRKKMQILTLCSQKEQKLYIAPHSQFQNQGHPQICGNDLQ